MSGTSLPIQGMFIGCNNTFIGKKPSSFSAMMVVTKQRDLIGHVTLNAGPPENVVIFIYWKSAYYATEPATLAHLTLEGCREVGRF